MTKARGERIVRRAKEIASTGDHLSWFYVAHAMHDPNALRLLEGEPYRSQINEICDQATKRKWSEQVR